MHERAASDAWVWSIPQRVLLAAAVLVVVALIALTRGFSYDDGREPKLSVLRIDPNTAPAKVLVTLPKIGPSRARAIVEAREWGRFRSADDLAARVRGIGPKTVELLRPYLSFEAEGEAAAARGALAERGR